MQTEVSAKERAAASDRVEGYMDSYVETSRKSTSEYGGNVLAKASAVARLPPKELAATAWRATAPTGQKEKAPLRSGSLLAATSSGSTGAGISGASAQTGSEAPSAGASWATHLSWAAQAAAAACAAANAASSTVSAAADHHVSKEG
jgi:hypothetical protein